MSVVADNKIFTPFGIDNVTVYRNVVNDILVCDQFLSAVPALVMEEHAKYNTDFAVLIINAFKNLFPHSYRDYRIDHLFILSPGQKNFGRTIC